MFPLVQDYIHLTRVWEILLGGWSFLQHMMHEYDSGLR
jgi:hypothetical protein